MIKIIITFFIGSTILSFETVNTLTFFNIYYESKKMEAKKYRAAISVHVCYLCLCNLGTNL